jgi:hypothetical protein
MLESQTSSSYYVLLVFIYARLYMCTYNFQVTYIYLYILILIYEIRIFFQFITRTLQ